MTYQEALKRAQERSAEFACTVYVHAIVQNNDDRNEEPSIIGYRATDWYDDAVVARFDSGNRKEL